MNLLLELSKNWYYPIMLGGIIVSALAYLFSTYRKNNSEASQQSNQILRGLIDDQRKEIDVLKAQVALLQEKVDHNQNLEKIIQNSLLLYFQANPDLAKDLIKKVKI